MSNDRKNYLITILLLIGFFLIILLFAFLILCGGAGIKTTTIITIEHKWIEDDKFYFADDSGMIYQLTGGYKNYNGSPRTRYNNLIEGELYIITFYAPYRDTDKLVISERRVN